MAQFPDYSFRSDPNWLREAAARERQIGRDLSAEAEKRAQRLEKQAADLETKAAAAEAESVSAT